VPARRPDPGDRDRALATAGTATQLPRPSDGPIAGAGFGGLGIETADRPRGALAPHARPPGMARYGGLTGSPDESGARRREKGLARPAPGSEQGAGNARVRRGMIQLAWRLRPALCAPGRHEAITGHWARRRDIRGRAPITIRGGGDPRRAWLPRRLREWARRPELPHRSSPWAEGPRRCAWLHHGPVRTRTPNTRV
jgi:hypothetical protein